MKVFKNIIDFMIETSLWVALSVLCLVKISNTFFSIKNTFYLEFFIFCSVVFSYNFIKYFSVFRFGISQCKYSELLQCARGLSDKNKLFLGINILCFTTSLYCFIMLKSHTKILLLLPFLLTVFYAISFRGKTLRNIEGLKIYVVGFVWAIVTVLLPFQEFELTLTEEFYIVFVQRFLITIILILPFEIRDLKEDNKKLQTVPQKIGVINTKYYGFLLILLFCILDYFRLDYLSLVTILLCLIMLLILIFSKVNQSKYYTSFMVEGIPMVWYLMLMFF